MADKSEQTIYERADIAQRAVDSLRTKLKDQQLEVLGFLESEAYCCGNGTVAIVKVDMDRFTT